MSQLKNQVLLLIIGVIVGLLLISQYQARPFIITTDKFDEVQDQEEILEELNKEQNLLKTQISGLRNNLEKLQSHDMGEANLELNDSLKEKIGFTAITGPGVQITFDDSSDVIRGNLDVNNDSLVHAADLRDIINLLRVSKAEAIAINQQRILINSTISCIGNNILVNNSHFLPPFQINAVGDADVLITQLKNNLIGIHKREIDNSLMFRIDKKENIVIPPYNSDLNLIYTQKSE
ncbi:MAG: DUF881 domain-containing protein [Melioribacteraceae bacterium]|nr:DUF881 domain-containing protein [Melioribacteraceae bacterium]